MTYWQKGVQLCAPKKFEIKDFLKVNEFWKGEKGFWVEGVGWIPITIISHFP